MSKMSYFYQTFWYDMYANYVAPLDCVAFDKKKNFHTLLTIALVGSVASSPKFHRLYV